MDLKPLGQAPRLLLAVELRSVLSDRDLPPDAAFEAALGKAAADPGDAARRELQGLGDLRIPPDRSCWTVVGLQKRAPGPARGTEPSPDR